MNIKELLLKDLHKFTSAPFLFVGSGFSRRYLGIENWIGMLRRFCIGNMKSYEYYFSTANSDLTRTAELMSRDFSEIWWNSDEFEESRNQYKQFGKMVSTASPLKFEISKYLRIIGETRELKHQDELVEFNKIVVDGIITTNWDTILDRTFPDYDIYIGQSDLINSNIQEIGDIYKIHGSITDFNSLILTEDDYNNFNNRNAYLAAKLLAIFMEHPIFFIGYSISDPNIKEILKSISYCISEAGLRKLENSLFFVEPIFDESENTYEKSYINIDSHNIPVTVIKVKDYRDIYVPLQSYERKLSVRRLKQIKSQIYEIVRDNDPNGRIALIDIDDDTNFGNVDFVMGVGVKTLHEKGIIGLCNEDFIEDIVLDNREFNPEEIVKLSLPNLLKYEYRTPFLKYLRLGGYINVERTLDSSLDDRIIKNAFRIETELNNHGVQKLKKDNPNAMYDYRINSINKLKLQILRDGKNSINLSMLEALLKSNFVSFLEGDESNFGISNFRSTVRIFDLLKYS